MTPTDTTKQNPPRRFHRRSYRERNFWELVVIASLQSETVSGSLAAVAEADAALLQWRERWGESDHAEEEDA